MIKCAHGFLIKNGVILMERKVYLTVTQIELLKNIKIAYIDIDGTLKSSDRKLANRTIESVKRVVDAGLIVVLTSGRSRAHTEKVSRKCCASQYIICSNGAEIYDYDQNKEIYLNNMSKENLIEIFKIAQDNDIRMIMNVGNIRVVTHQIDKDDNEVLLEGGFKDFISNNNVTQCILLDRDFYKMKKLEKRIEAIEGISVINKSKSLIYPDEPIDVKRTYYDLVQCGTDKGKSIRFLTEFLNVDISETIGIGDSHNDIAMFKTVGVPIVMGNSNDELKKMGKIVTDTNDNYGVATILDILYNFIKK